MIHSMPKTCKFDIQKKFMNNYIKNLVLILIPLIFLSFKGLGPMDDVISALRNGNAETLSKFFDEVVDISMPEKSNSYSKSQATVIMKDFFSNYKVKSFEVIHKGQNNNSIYCIGNLQTSNGNFRTTLYLKQRGDKQLLQEIRIEEK